MLLLGGQGFLEQAHVGLVVLLLVGQRFDPGLQCLVLGRLLAELQFVLINLHVCVRVHG